MFFLGIIALAVFALYVLAWIDKRDSLKYYASGHYDSRYNNRSGLANSTMEQLKAYHEKNGHYPKSLQELPVYQNQELVYYIVKDRTFSYYSSSDKNNSTYSFSWRDGAMNWTGNTCSNAGSVTSLKQMDTYKGSHIMPSFYVFDDTFDGTVCITTDLH